MSLSDISIHFTPKVLDDVIRKVGGTKCTGHSIGTGFSKGDSYLSQLFRLKVDGIDEGTGELKEVNLIVKSMSKNADRRKLFRSSDFFRNEINFYNKVIPIFEEFQKTRNIENPFNEYPRCFATYCDGSNDFIALEDVGFCGYTAPSRFDSLDFEHCKVIMRTLGRFHALSLAIKDQEPKKFEEMSSSVEETYFTEQFKDWYMPFLKDAIHVAMDAVTKEYPGTIYEEKARRFLTENLYDRLIHYVSDRTRFSTITQGDCWTPNFLNKGCSAVKIIDFQLARTSSPAVDITFFIYSCTNGEFRDNYYEDILKAYHTSASDLIKQLGSDPEEVFPYSALKDELENFGGFGCGMGIESLPLSMLENDEVADLEAINGENAILTDVWKIYPLNSQKQRLRIADAFKHAIDNGYIK